VRSSRAARRLRPKRPLRRHKRQSNGEPVRRPPRRSPASSGASRRQAARCWVAAYVCYGLATVSAANPRGKDCCTVAMLPRGCYFCRAVRINKLPAHNIDHVMCTLPAMLRSCYRNACGCAVCDLCGMRGLPSLSVRASAGAARDQATRARLREAAGTRPLSIRIAAGMVHWSALAH